MDISLTWSLWDRFTLVVGIYAVSIMFWLWTLTELLQVRSVKRGEWNRRFAIMLTFIPFAPIFAVASLVIYIVVIFARAARIPQGWRRLRKWLAALAVEIDHEVTLGGLGSVQHNPGSLTDYP